ncbi:putative GDP-fucose protein O-fucosyltransferase [Dioscorea sansibarensis]
MLVSRMSKNGPYMALHLRLEKDVWVRTGCLPGLGEDADVEIKNERSSNPNLLTSRSNLSAEVRYFAGLCPLNGLETSMLLNGLDIPKNTRIYWAGGEPFGGNKALKPLKLLFPHIYNKWHLAKSGELDDLKQKPSILAALDYIVCLKSQVFMENHGGNMARALQGHRTYMGYGMHIKPNKRLLIQLFQNKSLEDSEKKKKIKQIHLGYLDLDLIKARKRNMDAITFPAYHCMCNKDSRASNNTK